jgi:hypothetical protein
VPLGHGYNRARVMIAILIPVLVNGSVQDRKDSPRVTVGSHGDVLGKSWKKRNGRRVVIRANPDHGRAGRVIGGGSV